MSLMQNSSTGILPVGQVGVSPAHPVYKRARRPFAPQARCLCCNVYSLANPALVRHNEEIMKRPSLLIAFILAFACCDLFAQGKIDLQPSDTILSILQKNTGQTVELRMKSGEKIGGKVEKVAEKLVHLSQLSGAEFFDAAIDTADVSAVIVRTKSK
jgi:hypothetical protein